MKRISGIRIAFLAGTILILIILSISILPKASERLTYIERSNINDYEVIWNFISGENELLLEVEIPCELLNGVQIFFDNKIIDAKITTSLFEKESNRIFSLINSVKTEEDGSILQCILPNGRNISSKGTYIFKVKGLLLEESEKDVGFSIPVDISGVNILGGQKDLWWLKLYSSIVLFLLIYFIVLILCIIKKRDEACNVMMQTGLLVFLVFCFLLVYHSSNFAVFTDENDNIRGGMIIANGGVLYRDYYTQHTPLMYYICSLFALLGAKSVEQFRILYDMLLAILWGMLYLRNHKEFGKKLMFCLPILETIIVTAMFPQGAMIMADNIQGLCMVVLLLEFVRYRKKMNFDFLSSIIISMTLWCSIGAAFISVYSLFIVFVGVVLSEATYWFKSKNRYLKLYWRRYWKFLLCCMLPGCVAIFYLVVKHNVKNAYLQAFKFNTEIYPNYYMDGFGKSKIEPFILAIKNYFSLIGEKAYKLICINLNIGDLIKLVLVLLLLVLIIVMVIKEKHYFEAFIIFLSVCFNASRGADSFHSLPFWYSVIAAILIIIILFLRLRLNWKSFSVFLIFLVLCSYPYLKDFKKSLFLVQQPISQTESKVVDLTSEGEKIFIDAYTCDSIYLLYKNRFPVNRVSYILPWYMDWFEEDAITDLSSDKPRIVVWNTEREAWGIKLYAEELESYIEEYYVKSIEDDTIWIRK